MIGVPARSGRENCRKVWPNELAARPTKTPARVEDRQARAGDLLLRDRRLLGQRLDQGHMALQDVRREVLVLVAQPDAPTSSASAGTGIRRGRPTP